MTPLDGLLNEWGFKESILTKCRDKVERADGIK